MMGLLLSAWKGLMFNIHEILSQVFCDTTQHHSRKAHLIWETNHQIQPRGNQALFWKGILILEKLVPTSKNSNNAPKNLQPPT